MNIISRTDKSIFLDNLVTKLIEPILKRASFTTLYTNVTKKEIDKIKDNLVKKYGNPYDFYGSETWDLKQHKISGNISIGIESDGKIEFTFNDTIKDTAMKILKSISFLSKLKWKN